MISGLSRQDSISIGEIYFKVWTHTEDQDLLKSIEEDCIQNFMYHCILAKKQSRIFEPLLNILSPFHAAKNKRDVQKLVQKLWEPLLWRYLKVANGEVRCNATKILCEVFPLENPDEELENRAACQEQQLKIFQDLLQDEVRGIYEKLSVTEKVQGVFYVRSTPELVK